MCIYLYICVRFELKFSTGQVAPKPDSPVQNRTPGNPAQITGFSDDIVGLMRVLSASVIPSITVLKGTVIWILQKTSEDMVEL